MAKKRLDLKSLKGWTKAEELADPVPELLSLRPFLKALYIYRSSRFANTVWSVFLLRMQFAN